MLRRARRRREPGTDLIRAEASSLRLAARFDGVLFAYSLTMIPDWRGALCCACGHLVEGGRLVILDFGQREPGFAPMRRGFERYLSANHVHPKRDLAGEVERNLGRVEALRPTGAFITLLRGSK